MYYDQISCNLPVLQLWILQIMAVNEHPTALWNLLLPGSAPG